LKTQATRISRRKATSIALKCSVSKELLGGLEKAIDKLVIEADHSICKLQEKISDVPPTDCSIDTGKTSFRVSYVVKGPKSKRPTISLEKRKGEEKEKWEQ
jgi:hypothetical protein